MITIILAMIVMITIIMAMIVVIIIIMAMIVMIIMIMTMMMVINILHRYGAAQVICTWRTKPMGFKWPSNVGDFKTL